MLGNGVYLERMTNDMEIITHRRMLVNATSTLILAENHDRDWLVIQNDSDEDVYIAFGTAAKQNFGFLLTASGSTLELRRSEGVAWFGEIYAICASGGKYILTTEGKQRDTL